MSEPNGAVVWSWISDPFGDSEPNEDPDGDGETFTLSLRFAGQYYDQETGLHQNWWRSYSPGEGRYITPDPIGLAGGLNVYRYANASPTKFVDRNGLSPSMMDRFRDMANSKPGSFPDMALIVREFGKAAGDGLRCRQHFCQLNMNRPPVSGETLMWCASNATGDINRCADFCGAVTHHPDAVEKYRKACIECE